jgi:hypothetical protein
MCTITATSHKLTIGINNPYDGEGSNYPVSTTSIPSLMLKTCSMGIIGKYLILGCMQYANTINSNLYVNLFTITLDPLSNVLISTGIQKSYSTVGGTNVYCHFGISSSSTQLQNAKIACISSNSKGPLSIYTFNPVNSILDSSYSPTLTYTSPSVYNANYINLRIKVLGTFSAVQVNLNDGNSKIFNCQEFDTGDRCIPVRLQSENANYDLCVIPETLYIVGYPPPSGTCTTSVSSIDLMIANYPAQPSSYSLAVTPAQTLAIDSISSLTCDLLVHMLITSCCTLTISSTAVTLGASILTHNTLVQNIPIAKNFHRQKIYYDFPYDTTTLVTSGSTILSATHLTSIIGTSASLDNIVNAINTIIADVQNTFNNKPIAIARSVNIPPLVNVQDYYKYISFYLAFGSKFNQNANTYFSNSYPQLLGNRIVVTLYSTDSKLDWGYYNGPNGAWITMTIPTQQNDDVSFASHYLYAFGGALSTYTSESKACDLQQIAHPICHSRWGAILGASYCQVGNRNCGVQLLQSNINSIQVPYSLPALPSSYFATAAIKYVSSLQIRLATLRVLKELIGGDAYVDLVIDRINRLPLLLLASSYWIIYTGEIARDTIIGTDNCDSSTSAFSPINLGYPTTVICLYHLYDIKSDSPPTIQALNSNPDQLEDNLATLLYHELTHSLFDTTDTPIPGKGLVYGLSACCRTSKILETLPTDINLVAADCLAYAAVLAFQAEQISNGISYIPSCPPTSFKRQFKSLSEDNMPQHNRNVYCQITPTYQNPLSILFSIINSDDNAIEIHTDSAHHLVLPRGLLRIDGPMSFQCASNNGQTSYSTTIILPNMTLTNSIDLTSACHFLSPPPGTYIISYRAILHIKETHNDEASLNSQISDTYNYLSCNATLLVEEGARKEIGMATSVSNEEVGPMDQC